MDAGWGLYSKLKTFAIILRYTSLGNCAIPEEEFAMFDGNTLNSSA